MGTVFQHLPKISEETINSITLFMKSNKIITMQASVFCCVLIFIGYVNGYAVWNSQKRSDDALWNMHKRSDDALWNMHKRSDAASEESMDLAADRSYLDWAKRMDVDWSVLSWAKRMDAESRELDDKTQVEGVRNALKKKLAQNGIVAFALFRTKDHDQDKHDQDRHHHDHTAQKGLPPTKTSEAGEAEQRANKRSDRLFDPL